ncbi:MAG TPA: RcnB family protein [Nitrosospira sp.]|nr:RcnB family protein [Nitrosospira sp.]
MPKRASTVYFLWILISLISPIETPAEPPLWVGNHNGGENGHGKGKKLRNGNVNKIDQGYPGNSRGHLNYTGNGIGYGGGPYSTRNTVRSFDDHQHRLISNYFGPRFRNGHCPPGLSKKHNGCMPPGQVKQWRIGYPLPSNVVFYNLPAALLGQLGHPGPGYRYVRIAGDVLLIAAATGLVMDAIQDLNSL